MADLMSVDPIPPLLGLLHTSLCINCEPRPLVVDGQTVPYRIGAFDYGRFRVVLEYPDGEEVLGVVVEGVEPQWDEAGDPRNLAAAAEDAVEWLEVLRRSPLVRRDMDLEERLVGAITNLTRLAGLTVGEEASNAE